MKDEYDVIIIGAGCGGAAIAALLSHHGLGVLVLEKNRRIGGRMSVIKKDGFIMDHGHVVMRSEKGPHGDIFRMTKSKDLMPKFSHAKFWNFKMWMGDKIVDASPNLIFYTITPKGIKTALGMFRSIKDFWTVVRFLRRASLMPDQEIKKIDNLDFKTYLSRYSDNKYLRLFYGSVATVGLGALTEESSTGELIRIGQAASSEWMHMGYPVNGEGIAAIPNGFIRVAQRHGAEVLTKCPVEKILVEKTRVKGIKINGRQIMAKIVISNIGLRETVLNLLDRSAFTKDYVNKVENLKYSLGGMSLKFALNKKITKYAWGGYIPENLEQESRAMMKGKIPDEFPMMYVSPSNIDPSLAPKGTQSMEFVSGGPPGRPDEIEWDAWLDRMKAQAERLFPGLLKHTIFCIPSTPAHIALSMGRAYGDAVGVAQTISQAGKNRITPKSPIKGLYYVGADVGMANIASERATQSAIEIFFDIKKKLKT